MSYLRSLKKVLIIVIAITILLPFSLCADETNVKVGVVTGTVFESVIRNDNPNAQVEYFNLTSDLPTALETGKIDGYVVDEPIAKMLCSINENQYIAKKLTFEDYGIIICKQRQDLLKQFNEYIYSLQNTSELLDKQKLWFSRDEDDKHIDFDSIKNNEPVLTLAVNSSMEPFDYIKDDEYAGYEIDLVVSFCEEYGYGLNIEDTNFTGVLAEVTSGKAEFGSCVITITDERAEMMNFSSPIYDGGSVYVKKRIEHTGNIESFGDLTGKNIGIQSGSTYDKNIPEKIDNPNIQYYNFVSDMVAALDSNKISGFVVDKPVAEALINENDGGYRILGDICPVPYGICFPKARENSRKLCDEFNEYIKKIRIDGTLDEKYNNWIGNDESKKVVDKDGLTGENGTISFGISSTVGLPFCYLKNDEIVGFDVDLVYDFARRYGYDLDVQDWSLDSLFTALSLGKCDVGAAGICITDERKETINFPEPYYEGSCVVVVKDFVEEPIEDFGEGFFAGIASSFYKTFIREDRYKLFIDGILTTILITVLSIIFGTLLGFGIYMLYRNISHSWQLVIDALRNIIQKTPIVVILMILYYVILGDVSIKGSYVSIIGLSIIFGCSVTGLLMMGVNSIDKGQMEAATILGYSKNRAFIKIILPQAVINIISGYKSAIITLIKDSAIVGYIAVQDLTKVSDIVRSRTYEAFFPLISSAVIYYLIATLFILLINCIEFAIEPKKRKIIPLLKGVKTK